MGIWDIYGIFLPCYNQKWGCTGYNIGETDDKSPFGRYIPIFKQQTLEIYGDLLELMTSNEICFSDVLSQHWDSLREVDLSDDPYNFSQEDEG